MGHGAAFCAEGEMSLCSHKQFWGAGRTLPGSHWAPGLQHCRGSSVWYWASHRAISLPSGNCLFYVSEPKFWAQLKLWLHTQHSEQMWTFDYLSVWFPQVSGQCSTNCATLFPAQLLEAWRTRHQKLVTENSAGCAQEGDSRVSPPKSQKPLCLSHLMWSWITWNVLGAIPC